MKAKHWLLAGVGCVAAGILGGLAVGVYWLGQVRSFASPSGRGGAADPTEGLGMVLVGAALANVAIIGGLVVLVVGFIKLAKEPSGRAQPSPASRGPSGSEIRAPRRPNPPFHQTAADNNRVS